MRPLSFAIIDEADYVLIDEAQQPLIMSTPLVDDWDAMQERMRVGDVIAQQLIDDDAVLTAGPPPGCEYPQEEVVSRETVQRGTIEHVAVHAGASMMASVYSMWMFVHTCFVCCARGCSRA